VPPTLKPVVPGPGPLATGAGRAATCCCAVVLSGVLRSDSAAGGDPASPLQPDEVLELLRRRWQASHGLQLLQRGGRLYFQVMWNHLEQQSFPLGPEAYREALEELVATLNGLGVAEQVRHWLQTTKDRPRLGKALSLPLELPRGRASEFLL
jgi:Domain of unknown function (DUF3067)